MDTCPRFHCTHQQGNQAEVRIRIKENVKAAGLQIKTVEVNMSVEAQLAFPWGGGKEVN